MFKDRAKEIVEGLMAMDPEEALHQLSADGALELALKDGERVRVTSDLVDVVYELRYQGKAVDTIQVGDLLVVVQV
jgi:hypothetical protein